jgi:hypothetical protein
VDVQVAGRTDAPGTLRTRSSSIRVPTERTSGTLWFMSSSRARRSVAGLVAVVALAVGVTACEASDDGTALLRNETGRTDLRVLVRDGAGRPLMDRALDPAFRFDTQFTDRERQCLVSGDGSFEVRDGDGAVLIQHDFADRPVCERDELEVSADLELVWSD